jgi:Sodium/hydrogen exchanger family
LVGAVVSNRISERIRSPAPAIFLLAAAVASDVVPTLGQVSVTTVQRVVTIALAVILFDGGMQIGWRRFRHAAAPVVWIGVAGTFVTAARWPCWFMSCSVWSGGRSCWSARRWPPPTRRWCSPCWVAGRSPGAAAPSWKARPAPTTRSASP